MDETRKPAPVKAPAGAAQQPAPQETRDTGMKAPTPTLPKGGGAIRGIGEKFAANPVTGTGSMRVPIATSPSRGGAEPALELHYDSGSGSSVFGLGWQLSVPRIARKTDKGLPTYDDRKDVFVLSDAEDLVPVTDDAGNIVTATEGSETVVTYRPRVEGLFARIERRVRVDGTTYWRAVTPANVTSLYGTTAQAQIADPDAPAKVFSWLLEKTFDDRGNVLLYEYREEDLANVVGTAPCEAPRLGGTAKITNRYLKRIRYGNRTPATPDATTESNPAASDFLFEVVFDFGEHDPDVPTVEAADPATWPVRQDPFSTFRSTFEVRTYRLCRRVLMFHRMSELGASPCLVASTDLYPFTGHMVMILRDAM
ncbi:MAG: SpvB/TcaC N-terminal domain-containing protein [Byssovorax sp.]